MTIYANSLNERDSILKSILGENYETDFSDDDKVLYSSKGVARLNFDNDNVNGIIFSKDGDVRNETKFDIIVNERPNASSIETLVKNSIVIGIDEYIRYGDLPIAKQIISDWKNDIESFWDVMKDAAKFYTESHGDDECIILSCEPEVAYKSLTDEEIENSDDIYICGKSKTEFDSKLDIYVDMKVYSDNYSGKIGFYLSDYNSVTGENSDEVRNNSYRSWTFRDEPKPNVDDEPIVI